MDKLIIQYYDFFFFGLFLFVKYLTLIYLSTLGRIITNYMVSLYDNSTFLCLRTSTHLRVVVLVLNLYTTNTNITTVDNLSIGTGRSA